MEGWPRIPNPGGGPGKAPRTTGTSLPAPGSTVVANVEDELGDGMYSLRWAGQKIHVSSKSPLAKGQALLLKSETSPEGKPRLVVLGPAPEQSAPSGRIIYGPDIGKKQLAEQLLHQQAQQQSRSATLSHSRIGGNIVDTGGRAGQADAGAATGQVGGQMAAGVSKAVTVRAGDMMPGLIGLVLEPLPDFDLSAKRLLAAAKEEKQQLEEQQAAGSEEAGEDGEAETSGTDGKQISGEEAKKNRKDLLRPALPGQAGQGGKTGAEGAAAGSGKTRTPGQTPGAATAGQAQAQTGGAAAPGQPAAPQQPAPPAQAGSAPAAQPNPPPQQSASPAAPQPDGVQQTPLPGGTAPPPHADSARPAPVIVQNGGPAVPELPAAAPDGKTAPPQQRPPPAVPGTPPQTQPNSPAVNAAGQPAASATAGQPPAAPNPPSLLPGQPPARPDAPATPLPMPLPGTPVLEDGGPAVPDVPADGGTSAPQTRPSAPPAPASPSTPGASPPAAAQPNAPAPGADQPFIPPGQPGGQAAPQPLPGTSVAEGGGPIVPDVPTDGDVPQPQTRPAAPNASPPGTPETRPAAPGTSSPAPGTPAPQPPSAPGRQPATPGPGQPAAPPGGQAAPPQQPGAPVAEGGGPTVPDVPVDGDAPQPQTRPAAPPASAPSFPGMPGTAPAAPQPNAPAPPPPSPLPGTPAPAPQTPVPQAPPPPPAPTHPGAYPRPGTATYPRPTPQQSSARAAATDGATAAPSLRIKPEMLLREALGQMVGAAEIPLGNPTADAARLAPGNKMPEAVLDKAAAILLRGAGLTPDPETMAAAKALVADNVPVDRDGVQALLTAVAGIEDAGEREAALRAAARLLSKDVPLSPPLVAGMSDVMSRRATAHRLMDAAMRALAPDASLPMTAPEAEPLMAGARELLDMLHVDLGRTDAPAALERALSTFGREALGQALALVETSAQAVLENNPQLQKIDQALTAILSRLQPEMEQAAPPAVSAQTAAQPPVSEEAPPAPVPPPRAQPARPPPATTPAQAPAAVPQADIADLLPPAPAPLPPEASAAAPAWQPAEQSAQAPVPPPPAHPGRPINAYLNAPKALPIEEMLKKLPPMPKVVSLGASSPAIPPMMLPGNIANMANLANLAASGAQTASPALPPSTARQILARTLPQILPQMQGAQPDIPQGTPPAANAAAPGAAPETPAASVPPEQLDPGQIFRQAEALRRQSGVMNKLGSLFQIPGLNRRELELLRPGGFLDSFLSSAADRPDAARTKADAERLLRELMSSDPRTAERALREIPQKDSAVLRETASRLTQMESDAVRADPLMNKLSDAATSLRDLGRQLLAVKAENLALQDRNPGVMLAEVPFKLNDDAGDGRMQMFYRSGKKKGDGWSSRVILDLNTTRMGPVLGDMRFFGQDMTLNMFVDKQEAADYLSISAEELAENLSAKGFRVKMKFMVLPPPPVLDGERPVIAGENVAEQGEPQNGGVWRTPGRLDIEL